MIKLRALLLHKTFTTNIRHLRTFNLLKQLDLLPSDQDLQKNTTSFLSRIFYLINLLKQPQLLSSDQGF